MTVIGILKFDDTLHIQAKRFLNNFNYGEGFTGRPCLLGI